VELNKLRQQYEDTDANYPEMQKIFANHWN